MANNNVYNNVLDIKAYNSNNRNNGYRFCYNCTLTTPSYGHGIITHVTGGSLGAFLLDDDNSYCFIWSATQYKSPTSQVINNIKILKISANIVN